MPPGRMLGAVLITLVATSACRRDERDDATARPTVVTTVGAEITEPGAAAGLVWQAQSEQVDVARLTVPLDHDRLDGRSVELYVARHRATDPAARIGTLLVNPGGPGTAGSDLAVFAALTFSPSLVARFDIVGWDARGTGRSTPALDCVDDLAAAIAAIGLGPDALAQPGAELVAGCRQRSATIVDHVATTDSAGDIDAIRRALGEERISFLGFSYGAELGATWATMFPTTVRAAVLDGAEDPHADLATLALHRAVASEAALDTYLQRCSEDPQCAFHNGGDAAGALDALLASLTAAPLAAAPDRPPVTVAIARGALAEAMYAEGYWEQLSGALAAAQAGDGQGLLTLWDARLERQPDGTWSNATEARIVIRCLDHPERPSPADVGAATAIIEAQAPRLGPVMATELVCGSFPAPSAPDPVAARLGAGAGPIVVVGTTGDPVTPLAGAQAMADALEDGRLVVVDARQHTGYGANTCIDDLVHAYLIEELAPPDGSQCP